VVKPLSDALIVFWMHAIEMRRRLINWMIAFSLIPLGMLFFTRYLVPEENVGPRLIAGTIVFSLGFGTVANLAQGIAMARATHTLDLFITSPIHRLSYAAGMIMFWSLLALANATVVLIASPLAGIEIDLSPWLAVIALLTALSLTGVSVVIGTWSPDVQRANLIGNVVGYILVLVSPIYFPASRLPQSLELLSHFSPYTHAASGLTAALSGAGGFGDDIATLTALTVAGVAIGVVGMRWREA
jgi:ABC-2 type transport system permease protein